MIPQKPFDTYKWHWLSYAPTESLLEPPVFLGVLRALGKYEGLSFSDSKIQDALLRVEMETEPSATLARSDERNLIRNSGQYWRGTGLLTHKRGEIELTTLGRQVAEGRVTQAEFAAIIIQQTVLPNPQTEKPEEIKKWRDAQLQIKPFVLLLQILEEFKENHPQENAFITPNEIIKIVVPLAGIKYKPQTIASYILEYRTGTFDISQWPDYTPRANDKRFAREFLLFLAYYGLCRLVENSNKYDSRFYLDGFFDINIISNTDIPVFNANTTPDAIITAVRQSSLPSIIERQRIFTSILSRPGQQKFRKEVLNAYNSRCIITGEAIPETLEAAHILPVTNGGIDEIDNGFCLRIDIHRLFDSGNLRIRSNGNLDFSDKVKGSVSYSNLPKNIQIPSFVRIAHLDWRNNYL